MPDRPLPTPANAPAAVEIQAERTNGKLRLSVTPSGDLLVELSIESGRAQSEANPNRAAAVCAVPFSTRAAGEIFRGVEKLLPHTGSE